jgi:DNA phosphorothioation-dependent restriction protein DptH
MSIKQFNQFLVDELIEWFGKNIKEGYRYRFYSDNDGYISDLLRELYSNKDIDSITYRENDLPCIKINSINLIFLNESENGLTEHYISMIRDAISRPEKAFIGSALFVLHKSKLDTLINSAGNLVDIETSPLNIVNLNKKLLSLSKGSEHKSLFDILIDQQTKLIVEEEQTVFGYRAIYESIVSRKLTFEKLGLFNDKELLEISDSKNIEKRVKLNQKYYEKIDYNVTNFSDDLESKFKEFSPNFIKENLKEDGWQEIAFEKILREVKKNEETSQTISFVDIETEDEYFMRDKSLTASGKRTKNIIIFSSQEEFLLKLKFKGSGIAKNEFRIKDITSFEYSKNIFSLKVNINKPLYLQLKLSRTKNIENFTFNILLLHKDWFYLNDIKNSFLINPKKEEISLQTDEYIFNFSENSSGDTVTMVDENPVDIIITPKIDIEEFYKNRDEVNFSIQNQNNKLKFFIEEKPSEKSISLPLIYNNELENILFNKVDSQYFGTKGSIVVNNRESNLIGLRKTLMNYEQSFIEKSLFRLKKETDTIEKLKSINNELGLTFESYLNYFHENKTTPSLASWNNDLCIISQEFVDAYLSYMESVENNTTLSNSIKDIFEIGFVYKDNKRYLSPFSPLTVSYILYFIENIKEDESYADIASITLKRLNHKGLFPYLFVSGNSYYYTEVMEENSFWLTFKETKESDLYYVSKLVNEKIDEFKKSFKSLFKYRSEAPLIINSINNAKNRELFYGIVKYYIKTYQTPLNIRVNIYDANYLETSFDIFSDSDSYEDIAEKYNIKKDKEIIIDTIRKHLSYGKYLNTKEQKYCHLAFYKNNQEIHLRDSKVSNRKSGLVVNGIISGNSSEKEADFYYSGFGLRGIEYENYRHLRVAKIYNAMQKSVYLNAQNYDKESVVFLVVNKEFNDLEKSYKSSIWTTIIDPKVTLKFFMDKKDLVLIHYSDQYSNSADYDAITVTTKIDLYENLVGGTKVISEFNAFNGKWLLEMFNIDDKIKRERKSIISAYKYITAFLSTEDITWIPLSLAEMIRVSGGTGLAMSQSDFSRYNQNIQKGAISDDVLLVGLKGDDIILYPVEVKAGSADLKKAKNQVKALKDYFYTTLFPNNSIKNKLLKGLFVRQLFMHIEKYELYEVFDKDYFNKVYNRREELLKGEYQLVELENYSMGAVVAFLDKQYSSQFTVDDDKILECKLSWDYVDKMIVTSYNELKDKLFNGGYETDISYLLDNQIDKKEETPKEIENEVKSTNDSVLTVKFGTDIKNRSDILWYPTDTTKTFNTNTGIIGTMGTGKTQFTKSLVTQLVNQFNYNVTGSKIDIIIFDYKGDYIGEEFRNATNATIYELEKLPFNPLALFGEKPKLPIHTGRTLTTTLAKAFNLGTVQKSILKNIIQDAYKEKGILSSNKDTWNLAPPTLNDVWKQFINQEKVQQDSLYVALDDLIEFEIFESDTSLTKSLYDIIDGVTVINLSGYDSNIQNLVVAIILDLFYIQMHNHGSSIVNGDFRQISKMILVDEADNFMSQDFESLKKILKEGREFGVGTILSTQELTHFKTSEDNYANYIFSWVVHKVSTIKSQDIQSVFNISNKSEAENLMSQIRELQKHYSLYVDGNKKDVLKMRDLAFWELLEQ